MEFIDKIQQLTKKIPMLGNTLTTEEATKNALIMPFLQSVLGYDVFNPLEVIPEFTADVGTKKGEKVDYALMKDNEVQILIECKKYREPLSLNHANQLYRYFSVTNARIGILTNGVIYQFYTDLDSPNKMDEVPFLTLNLENIDEHLVPELQKLTKQAFDVDEVVDAAGELKYLSEIKKNISRQFEEPDDDFIKLLISKVYDGMQTAKIKVQFSSLIKKSLKQFLNEQVNSRLKNAIDSDLDLNHSASSEQVVLEDNQQNKKNIITTEDEADGYAVVKAILRVKFDAKRIVARDTQSYFGILLDDNNRKPLCRLHFNTKQKYLGIIDESKQETKYQIDSVDNIYDYTNEILDAVKHYD
ncbi:type I restriction endonuclease [Photobacterium damselae]|uniref:type I restriction endonuclease n=1 Tax=Photobacterium damselae TaxID=38293 RepID=UPI0040679006